MAPAVVALLFAVAAVQITRQSGQATGTDGMLIVLADGMASVAGGVYPFFATASTRSAPFSPGRTPSRTSASGRPGTASPTRSARRGRCCSARGRGRRRQPRRLPNVVEVF